MLKKLIITGSGIKSLSHLTKESEAAIEQAEFVLYLVNEPIMGQWIEKKAKKSESLDALYFSEELRPNAYKRIIGHIKNSFDLYNHVCVIVYGHPLILSNAIMGLIKEIDRNTIELSVLPAISAFDCLLSDLEIDPFTGCFSIEANEFINKKKSIDITNHLIIWQIGMIEDGYTFTKNNNCCAIELLKQELIVSYPSNHECILYEASIYPHVSPKKIKTTIESLDKTLISRITTLYIPPVLQEKIRGKY